MALPPFETRRQTTELSPWFFALMGVIESGGSQVTLRTKILGGYGIVLALVAIVYVSAVLNLNRLGNASEAILRENYRSILAAEAMINAIERQDSATLLVMTGEEDTGFAQFRENEILFLQWLARAKDNLTIEGEGEVIETITAGYSDYLDTFSDLRDRRLTDSGQLLSFYQETMEPQFTLVRTTLIELRDMNQETMIAASDRAQGVATRAVRSMTILGAAAIGFGLVFSLFLSRIVTRPLKDMTRVAKRIADGDYDVELAVQSGDELGQLGEELMVMSRKLKEYHDLHVGQLVEEKSRGDAIIESIDDGLILVDSKHMIMKANPKAARVFHTTVEELEGKHFLEAVRDEELFERIKLASAKGKSPESSDTEDTLTVHDDDDDRTEYYHYTITPVRRNDQLFGIVLLLQDVTAYEELDRLKSDFVLTASHELRTPLTSMAMSLNLLMERSADKLPDDDRELLEAAEEESARLRALVNNLLDLSKIESGQMEMDFADTDVQLLVDKAVSVVKAQAEEKKLQLIDDLPDHLPSVKADPNKIVWVLTNLLSNAVRYTQAEGCIQITGRSAGRSVHISVSDNGTGIPLEYQSRIFDKFVQVKGDESLGGSGLGLAISKEIVKAHGGTIWLESEPGEGSTFTFTLPVAAARTRRAEKGDGNHETDPNRGR